MKGRWNTIGKAALCLVLSLAMVLANMMFLAPQQLPEVKAAAAEVHVYADTPGDELSAKYTLTANGTNVPVIKYSRNGNNFDIARFACADNSPQYTIQVKEDISQVTIYPERYYPQESIQISQDKRSVTFSMSDKLRYAFVMINGGPADQAGKPYLAIINDPPEQADNIPDKTAANVLNFKTFSEQYLQEHPNSEAQQAEPAGTTSGGTSYEAGALVDNGTSQVRFPDKRKMTADDVTLALQAALDAIYAQDSSYDTLYFPAGTYVCSGLEIRGRKGKDVTVYLEEGALVKNRIQECMQAMEPAIGIWDSEDITISGRGIFDGNGVENYRKDRHDAKDSCHQGGVMIVRSTNIVFNDTYVRDAKQWNWESHGSKRCTLNNVKGLTPYNQPWVDGLDMASAQDLTINGALTMGNDDNFASGHYNPSDGFPNTVAGYDQYNSDSLQWDTEDSFHVSVSNTLGWSFSGGNGIRLGHDCYGHAMKDYTFENVNTTNFAGGGNGITVQNGTGNNRPYPAYENLVFKNCSFDTTRVGTNFNINGLSADKRIDGVTLDNCWFSNGDAVSSVSNVTSLTVKNLFIGKERVNVSSQAKLTTTEIGEDVHDWVDNHAPVFSEPSNSAAEVEAGKTLAFTVQAEDADNTPVTLGVKEGTLPQGAAFAAASGQFTWMPEEGQVGTYTVIFTAADAYETTEKSVEITVKSSQIDTITVAAMADATVKSYQTEKERNYGSQDYIRTLRMKDALAEESAVGLFGETVGDSTSDNRDCKIAFLSFDAAQIRESLQKLDKAEVQLTYIGRRDSKVTGEDTLLAVPVTEAWSEEEIKWNNMPLFGSANMKSSAAFAVDRNDVLMAQDEKYSQSQAIDGTKVTIDVTEWVRALPEDAQVLSLAVCDAQGWELAFVSHEGVQNMEKANKGMEPSLLLSVKKDSTQGPGDNTGSGDNTGTGGNTGSGDNSGSGGNTGSGDNSGSGGNTPPGNKPETKIMVNKVSITAPSKKIAAGKKVQLKVSTLPKNASVSAVEWSSSNKKYATVNNSGLVTTKRAGKGKTVTIKATAKDGSGKYASVRIKIMKSAVKKVTIKNKPKTLRAGQSIALKTTVKTTGKKAKDANRTLKWSSSNTKYATVTSKGKVTAKKAGKGKSVTIRAVSTDGTNRKDSVKMRIR